MLDEPNGTEEPREAPSRSQRKREVEELQKLGARLAELSDDELRRAPIPVELREAVEQLRATRRHEARRRQLQFIGRLMREVDPRPIGEMFARIDRGHAHEVQALHLLERWRDRLIDGDDALLEEILGQHPELDRQRLRQLVRNARGAAQGAERTRAARALLRCLRGS